MPLIEIISSMYQEPISDREVEEILFELNARTDNGWYIRETVYHHSPSLLDIIFRRKHPDKIMYRLLYKINQSEYQVINIGASRDSVLSFMYGYLNGLGQREE